MGTTSTKRAIRNTLYRLGLHTTPKGVVHALAQQGIQVSQDLVQQVRFEMLNESNSVKVNQAGRLITLPDVRRCPKGFPRR